MFGNSYVSFYLIFLNKQLTRFFSDRYQDVRLFQRSNISTSLLKSANVKLCWLMFWPIYIHSDIFCYFMSYNFDRTIVWFLSFSSHSKKTNTFNKILSHHLSFFFCLLRVLKIFSFNLLWCKQASNSFSQKIFVLRLYFCQSNTST